MIKVVCARVGVALSALLATISIGVGGASGAVTSSDVTSPADGSFFQDNLNDLVRSGHQVTFSGTAMNNGRAGSVDLVCTFAQSGGLTGDESIQTDVPVASDGTFSIELPAPPLNRPCVVRAVPGGSTALPST